MRRPVSPRALASTGDADRFSGRFRDSRAEETA
jgi:hypothetical protein